MQRAAATAAILAALEGGGGLVAALSAEGRGASRLAQSAETTAQLSPVTRVVQLLKELGSKVEQEGKAEESLYQKYMCWGRTAVDEKTAAISKAQSRADMLDNYIKDIDAGRVEFTTERVDLEKELKQLNADIESANQLRQKESKDFDDATAEMDKAIGALNSALDVLREATSDAKDGTLLAVKGKLANGAGEGFAARAAASARLSYASELGDKFLAKGDALFLRKLLTGDVEVPARADWKKLNRKATFKMSYKARSFKIQDVLTKLLQTFQASKADAVKKEDAAKSTHEKLIGTKEGLKTSAEEALVKLEKENGAKGMSRAEASEESSDLKEAISDDTRYISQTKDSMKTKTEEWKTRSTLRANELAAISKATAILASDDAKDLFKKSFKSQGYAFLQSRDRSQVSASETRHLAAQVLTKATAGDLRVADLVVKVASQGHFDEVVSSIDKMITLLNKEEATELERKETCEKDRMTDTRDAIVAARAMDDMSDSITSLQADIKEIDAEVVAKQGQIKSAETQLAEATELRQAEAKAYAASKKDDEDAVALIQSAHGVLQQFYSDNGLMLTQQRGSQAPIPPPTTWDAPYGGKTGESTGILSILSMIQDDISNDLKKAEDAENAALGEFGELKSDLEKEMSDLQSAITTLEGTKADKAGAVQTTEGERRTKSGFLGGVMQKIAGAQPGCDYFTINYPVRSKNRQIEVDGLQKAKTILSGGSFAAPADATRELKPGDALLQRH